jgi:hypothetical protein
MLHFDMNIFITRMKKQHPFLKASPSQALQARAGNLGRSFDTCFNKENRAKAPDSSKKFRPKESFSVPQGIILEARVPSTCQNSGTRYKSPAEEVPPNPGNR